MPTAKSKSTPDRKQTKIQIRLHPAQKQLIARAAEARQTTLSNFLLENACVAAQQVLADRLQFLLPPDQWAAFCKALDASPKERPALKKLLTEASVFDGSNSSSQ